MTKRVKNVDRFDRDLNGIVNQARQAVYGPPEDNFANIAKMQEVMWQVHDPLMRVIALALCTKLARLIKSPKDFDTWLDIAGYARTAMMVLDSYELQEAEAALERAFQEEKDAL